MGLRFLARLGEADERGHAGGEDHEQQTDHDLVGGLRVIAFPVADDRPRAAHVHDAEPDEADDGRDRRDELRHVTHIAEQVLNGGAEIHEGNTPYSERGEGQSKDGDLRGRCSDCGQSSKGGLA